MTESDVNSKDKYVGSFLILLLIVIVYSNSFHATWHFDDYSNILWNDRIKFDEFNIKTFINFFYKDGKMIDRPIAHLSFGLNWFFGKDNVFGYHIVNILFHYLTSTTLFFIILNLFRTPNLRANSNEKNVYFIALLASALWALNPIHTQAVTYIVQRMALMAAMFYLIGILLYLKFRFSNLFSRRLIFIFALISVYLLAIGSKENAIVLPFSLLIVEFLFFHDLHSSRTRRILFISFIIISILLIIIIFLLFLKNENSFNALLKKYDFRSFTLQQRLLTQPRVLIFYISQIFYPIPNRISIEHDIVFSTSLFHPWTTLPAIILIISFIVIAIYQAMDRPLLSFAILFFFLNHIIESSIVPLEMVFEHRNYLPSAFLFIPISAGLHATLAFYAQRQKLIYMLITLFVVGLIIGFGSGTFNRNTVWLSEISLWQDALQKAPNNHRPLHNLALSYAQVGQLDQAMNLYKKALKAKNPHTNVSLRETYSNLSTIYENKKEYEMAIRLSNEALRIDNEYSNARYNLILQLLKSEQIEEAFNHASILISKDSETPKFLNLYGFLLYRQNRYEEALSYFRKVLRISPNDNYGILYTGVTLSALKEYNYADWYLRLALQNKSNKILTLFHLIENSLKAESISDYDMYINKLFSTFSAREIEYALKNEILNNPLIISPTPEVIKPLIGKEMEKRIISLINQ